LLLIVPKQTEFCELIKEKWEYQSPVK
jgi:hypothetical protein